MPITAKLSREFYERFGDKVVNEMVDLFNRIDDAARADLRLLIDDGGTARASTSLNARGSRRQVGTPASRCDS